MFLHEFQTLRESSEGLDFLGSPYVEPSEIPLVHTGNGCSANIYHRMYTNISTNAVKYNLLLHSACLSKDATGIISLWMTNYPI